MNYTIENPKGIDNPIQLIQNHLYSKLGWENIEAYGRVFKLQTDKGFAPRAFLSGKEYKDVFTNDAKTASVFFICDDQHATKEGVLFTVKVKIVFMVNIKKIVTNLESRGDTDVQEQAISTLLKMRSFNFNGEIETQIEEIFKGFSTESIKLTDMQPYHVFSLNGEVSYTYQGNCFK